MTWTTKPLEEKKGGHLRSALFRAGDPTDVNAGRHRICERVPRDVMFGPRKGDLMHVRQLSDEDCRATGPLRPLLYLALSPPCFLGVWGSGSCL
ncbi:hypothetical protein AVEN_222626-1 [Araneus ventricosus]|uniref:Uncharacterized protein n=1 Tax=Araneus ventricosus TaxID=182803 RepID=A0A4Y2KG05_ARAVE|nr:hypothetical protein AVEN_222626-1 [Araneus ventricosus]